MSKQIELVAILTPKPGYIDTVIETLAPYNKYVEENEPGVLRYRMYRQINVDSGKEDVVFSETFQDQEALHTHQSSSMYQALEVQAASMDLLSAPLDIKIIKPVGGFAARAVV